MADENQENKEIGNNSVDESQVPSRGGCGRGRGSGRHDQATPSNQVENEHMGAEEDDDHSVAESEAAHAARAVRGMTLTRWTSMRLDTFDGTGTPVNAVDWLRKMEKRISGGRVLLKLGTLLVGSKTVDQYELEFSNIVRFVPTMASDEREKARRFIRGLNAQYREVMGRKPSTVYLNVVEEARGIEVELQITAAQKNRSGNAAGGY
ncbi:hypothetical protein E2562_035057 [Oryza meyeriana var. granulata]|uniref:Retrotransposon gag domain-containing protein n=1 Tax=Oryza meyeriana var. granulata TaxID=110450 RepID=A0A6G1CL53_9ORYZ|nr:hypothetical protein E2562_035057 [Oryza meyeriana var. granulata]